MAKGKVKTEEVDEELDQVETGETVSESEGEAVEEKPSKKAKAVEEEQVDAKGKFVLLRRGEEFIIRTDLGVLVAQGLDESSGTKMLLDMNR